MEDFILINQESGDRDFFNGTLDEAKDEALDWSIECEGVNIIILDDCGKPVAEVWA